MTYAESGQMLSHYRLVEKVGEGGMGVVWKAEDTILGRDVAIKVLHADARRDDKHRKMFFQEARAASAVSAAHIVQVHEFGHEGDLDFIVMEYVEGLPLNKLLMGRPLPPHKIAELAWQIAHALAKAHARGLVHRDLKPGNILVTPDAEVKVVDFGLAILLQPEGEETVGRATTRVTEDEPERRKITGTLPYMSPEQARAEELDARSDIFSMGTILYEMTTGMLPFIGPDNVDVIDAVRRARPTPVHDLVPQVPIELERIITKAMAPRRADRYHNAEDMAIDLRHLGRELETGSTRSYESLRQTLPAIKVRPRWLWPAVGVAVTVAVLALLWQLLPGSGAPVDPLKVLVLPLEVRGQEAGDDYVGKAFAEALVANLAPATELTVLPVPGKAPAEAQRAALDQGAGRLLTGALTRQGDTVTVTLSLVDVRANRVLWGDEKQEDSDRLSSLATTLARVVVNQLGVQMPTLHIHFEELTTNSRLLGSQLYLEALAAVRREEVEAALATTERLVAAMPREPEAHVLRTWALFSDAWAQAPTSPARHRYERQLANLVRVDPGTPWDDIFQAKFLSTDSRYSESVQQFDGILERDDLTPALQSYILRSRSQAHEYLRNREAAFRDLDEARRLDPANDDVYAVYSTVLEHFGYAEESVARARQAIAINPSEDNLWPLAWALQGLAAWEEASGLWNRACRGSQNQGYCASYAYTLERAGQSDEARIQARLAEELPEIAWGVYTLARYQGVAGDRAGALQWLSHFLEIESYPEPDAAYHSDFKLLRDDADFESLVAAEWKVAANYFGESCKDTPSQSHCAFYAVSLARTGDEGGARAAAQKAGELPESETGALYLARYHSLTGAPEETVRLLRRYLDLRGKPDPEFAFDHPDFAAVSADPEFQVVISQIRGAPAGAGG